MADLLIHEHKKNGAGSYDNVYRKTKAKIVETEDGGTAEQKFAAMTNHIADKNNPHNVTAAQVGARPNTWTPTASDVGADPAGSSAQALQNAKNYADTAAYEKAKEQGYTGTEAEFYAALVSLKDGPFLPLSGGTLQGTVKVPEAFSLSTISGDGDELVRIDGSKLSFINGNGGVYIYEESENEQTPVLAFFGLNGDELTILRYISDPQRSHDAANKGYVDDLVGNINTVLDTINGEVV